MRRRSNALDGLTVLNRGSWCVVSNMSQRVLSWVEIGCSADWQVRFCEIINAASAAGWVLEREGPSFSNFFCSRGGLRVHVCLQPSAPSNPLSEWVLPPPARTIRECLQLAGPEGSLPEKGGRR
jgi:hypothetical protein